MFSKKLLEEIEHLDAESIARYNRNRSEKYRLHTELGPCPYEGDIENAPIVLLLANPGFDNNSHVDDHRFHREGWALSGLHAEAPDGMRIWWRARLERLTEEFGLHHVANNIAAIQLCAWASRKFDGSLRLPSRQLQLKLAESAVERGALVLITRSFKLWCESPSIATYPRMYRANSYLNSRVTEGNYPMGWQEILAAMVAASTDRTESR